MIRHLYLLIIACCFALPGFAQQRTPLEQHIHDCWKLVQERRVTEALNGTSLYDKLKDTSGGFQLPLGIGGGNNGKPPVIVDSIRFLPDHAEITTFMVVTLPGSDKELMFAARGVPLSSQGGLVGTARMELVNQVPVRLFGDSTAITFMPGKTYIEFDCNGFKKLGIGAEIDMTKKLVRLNPDGTQNLQDRVKAKFETTVTDLNDILAAVSIEPFQVRGVKNVTFTVQDAVIDLSDDNNSTGMVFPTEYTADDKSFWRGFYLRAFTVELPPELKDRKSKKAKAFAVRNALIDEKGFSGEISAKHLIPLEDGDLGGWSFSVDEVKLDFVANQLKAGSLVGGVNVPITGDTTRFDYNAVFHPGEEYVFNIKPKDSVDFDIFTANVMLLPSSYLEVAVKDGKFQAMANLSGTMSVLGKSSADSSGKSGTMLSVPDIRFEQLVVSTQAPFIHSGTFALTGSLKMPKIGGYGISINKINFVKDGEKRGISFDVNVNLMNAKDSKNGFSADASLAVLGKVLQQEDGRQRYRFSNVKISRIAIDVNQGAFALKGSLEHFDSDEVYGDGFKGSIAASINMCGGSLKMDAMALFGAVQEHKYWYADIMVDFPTAFLIIPPAIAAKGFGGGLYYGVKPIALSDDASKYKLGATSTGVRYKPDANAGIGVKASIKFIAGSEKAINGLVAFEISFNKGGGVNRITFRGQCNVLSIPIATGTDVMKTMYEKQLKTDDGQSDKYDPNQIVPEGAISVGLMVDVDFENEIFYANLKAYINVAGVIKGTGNRGLAGEGEIYAGPDGWHMYMGTPDNPVSISILDLAKASSYFMVGKDLPGSPPPPANVSSILGGMDLDYMRDMNSLSSGTGFAFGAGLNFDTGDMSFLMFYARFAAGLGFDVMMKDYGDNFHCEGKSGPIGINGWFANGQVYAYFQGKIGIRVNLFFKKGNFDIIDLGAAAVLQAKLPNPTWMRGIVGGRFSILGGMVSGDCKFEVTLGKECKIVSNNIFAEAGVQVIGDYTPAKGATAVDVFVAPQIVFNMPVGKVFNITDDIGKRLNFRARLEYFNIREGANNIPATMEWNSDNTVVILHTPNILPGEKTLRMTARISFEQESNGSWTPYMVDGAPYAEVIDHDFITDKEPLVIRPDNVSFTYPVINQRNYYKGESSNGYILLKKGQDNLFAKSNDFKQIGRLTAEGDTPQEFPLFYTTGKVSFSMPQHLKNDKIYTLELLHVPTVENADIDRNVTITKTSAGNAGTGSLTVQTKTAEGTLNNLTERVIYTLQFRSSIYSTFSEKVDRLPAVATSWPLDNGIDELRFMQTNNELFDAQEIDENGNSQVLQFEAVLEGIPWYMDNFYPYVYAGYPVSSALELNWRNTAVMGVPPVKAIYLRQHPAGLKLGDSNERIREGASVFVYNLPYYMAYDYVHMQARVADVMATNPAAAPERMREILIRPYKRITAGSYKFKIKYVLPGTNTVTSEKVITIPFSGI
ncbi:hypothetical protein [Chitinophaga rhizophila]|uniref:Uncharacterized protein n=1 Tax=Chitinophaga rhizophila TaxID=2866212 RepID=A0ABS7GJ66_9BACT|nr:hypothetical protein [Chitinophaga rhizophila]MBW8687739.1 hypothetical protein [Chitinophaga rhizophila]